MHTREWAPSPDIFKNLHSLFWIDVDTLHKLARFDRSDGKIVFPPYSIT